MNRFAHTRVWPWGLAGLFYAILCGSGEFSMFARAEEIAVQRTLPREVQEIEIVYIEGRDPQVFGKSAVTPPLPLAMRPLGPVVDLLASAGEVQSFGKCSHRENRAGGQLLIATQAEADGLCGHVLLLQPQGASLDALSYSVLQISGETSGRATIALADEAARRRDDNIPLTEVTGRFDLRVPLGPAARRLDLRRLVSLVILPEGKTNSLELETLTLAEAPRPQRGMVGLGFWVWEYREAVSQSHEVLDACQQFGCTRIAVQTPAVEDSDELWDAYGRFLNAARDRGLTPLVLDGAPETIRSPATLIRKIRRLMPLFTDKRPLGVQLDIEPYLLEDFFVDPESGFKQYLTTIDQIKEVLAGRAQLSIVMPFWFTSQLVKGRPVAFAVMDQVDEVAIMSYRTDVTEVREIAEDTLRYGDLAGVPVWLAIETRPLPFEQHVLLKRESRRALADAYLDRARQRLVLESPPSEDKLEWFRVSQRSTIRPERLTFASQNRKAVQAAVAAITSTPPHHPSLAGVVIHDLNGLRSLPE